MQFHDHSHLQAFGHGQHCGQKPRSGVVQPQHREAERVRDRQLSLDQLGGLLQARRPAVTAATFDVGVVAFRDETVDVNAAPDGPFGLRQQCGVSG